MNNLPLLSRVRNLLNPRTAPAAPMKTLATGSAGTRDDIPLLFPIGHFYSPIADPADIRSRETQIWKSTDAMPGIRLDVEDQLRLLSELAVYSADIDWPVEVAGPTQYFYSNDQYPALDAEFLYSALRHFQPKRMIEVGSGFSSLIVAEVNRRHLRRALKFTCIEPFPRQFLIDGVDGITELVRKKVEDVEVSFFDQLCAGDVLFIDSSHVSKIGSDVNFLFFEVLPRLKSGVIVHIHDVFLPDEYPKVWAIEQGRNWNEQYLVRAFLQFNSHWKIMWAANFMATRHSSVVTQAFPRFPKLGGGGEGPCGFRDSNASSFLTRIPNAPTPAYDPCVNCLRLKPTALQCAPMPWAAPHEGSVPACARGLGRQGCGTWTSPWQRKRSDFCMHR